MKVIYMGQTLQIIHPEEVKKLMDSGEVKETEEGIKYLHILVAEEENN